MDIINYTNQFSSSAQKARKAAMYGGLSGESLRQARLNRKMTDRYNTFGGDSLNKRINRRAQELGGGLSAFSPEKLASRKKYAGKMGYDHTYTPLNPKYILHK